GQVHRTADGRNGVGLARVPVGQVAMTRHLKGPQHADIEMAATHHAKRIGVMEERASGQQCDRLLAGVDEVPVFLSFGRRRAHADDTVFRVQHDLAPFRQVVAHLGGQADAQIDDTAFGDVLGHAGRHLLTIQRCHFCSPTATTRCTNRPGVTMASGSSSPSSTTASTWAMVVLAAVAMMGPKLRAVLRYTRLPQRSARCALMSAKSACRGYSSR